MSDEPDETTYYLRLLSMYMDLGTEIVLNVFIHHSPNKNAEHFLVSNHALLINLNSKGILNKEEYDKAIEKPPNLKRFDISLLITLSVNLFTKEQLPHPTKGWGQPPRSKDKSIGADLLRLRKIRNAIVGHHHAARLPKWRFDEEWEKLSEILLRIQRQIAQENEGEPELLAKIEAYRIQSLDSSLKNKHDPIIKEWFDDMSKIQDKVEKLTKRLEGFDVYFKNNCDRYERYITLLVKGGHFVLTTFIKNEVQRQQKDLRSILDENKVSLSRSLSDPKQIGILYPTEPDSSLQSLNVSSWNVSLSAVVILHLFERNMGRSHKQAVKTIEDAHKNYVNTALIALDSNTFEDYSTNLKASIQVLSDFLDENQTKVYDEILENCKKKIAEEEFKTFMDELKSQGSQMKTFQDIFKETIRDTKSVLQEMITKGISFKNDRDLELKMITLGTDEEKKVLAEEILTDIWHEALDRSLASSDFPEVKKEVMNIIAEIRKSKSVKDIAIETRCILLQITCSSPSDMLNLINYFESDSFHETLHSLSSELGYYFNTAMAIFALLPIDSLWKVINIHEKSERRGIRLPIKVSSPAGMLEVRSLLKSERIANSKNSIADALSKHFGEHIDLNVCTDMKELEGIIDEGMVSSDSSSDSVNAETDAENGCNFNQLAIQRTEQDSDDQEIKHCISPDECNIKMLSNVKFGKQIMASVCTKQNISTYVFLHLNTTCLPKGDHTCRVTEICLMAINRNDLQVATNKGKIPKTPRVTNKLVLCLKPDADLLENATEISGLTNKCLANQLYFTSKTVASIESFLKHIEQPICFIAHNGYGFDFAVLKSELVRTCQPTLFDDMLCADSLEALRSLDSLDTQNEYYTSAKASMNENPSLETDLDTKPKLKKRKTTPATKQADEQTPRLMTSRSLPTTSTTQPKSFRLREYYENKFGSPIRQSHTAEGFLKGLLTVAQTTPGFFQWVDSNAKKFKLIEPAET